YANAGTDDRDWFRHAIYCDNDTSGHQIYNNLTFDVPRPIMLNDCDSHVITNNVFIDTSGIVKLHLSNVTNIVFTKNIIYSTTNLYVDYAINSYDVDNNSVVNWSSNILYSAVGGYFGLTGIPTNAVRSDPKFVSLSPLNPSFEAGSP